jgi:CRP/FNR family cyclic AMP-dependent transcriptional regulator
MSTTTTLSVQHERMQVLRRCQLFGNWPDARLAEAAAIARIERYTRGKQVFAGSPQRREVFVIASGRIEVSRSTALGKKFVLSVVGPYEALALVRLLMRVPLHYEYHAYDDSALLHLPCDDLIRILDAEPILWRDLATLMCTRQGESVRLFNDRTLCTLEQRMAAALVDLVGMHGLPEKGRVELGLRLPQEQLGAMLGVTRQSVNRVLRVLERAGAISADYNRITICDLRALCEIAARRG